MSSERDFDSIFEYIKADDYSNLGSQGISWLVRFKGGAMVGWIKWIISIRSCSYCFVPSLAVSSTALNANCLRHLTRFCEIKTIEKRLKKPQGGNE